MEQWISCWLTSGNQLMPSNSHALCLSAEQWPETYQQVNLWMARNTFMLKNPPIWVNYNYFASGPKFHHSDGKDWLSDWCPFAAVMYFNCNCSIAPLWNRVSPPPSLDVLIFPGGQGKQVNIVTKNTWRMFFFFFGRGVRYWSTGGHNESLNQKWPYHTSYAAIILLCKF